MDILMKFNLEESRISDAKQTDFVAVALLRSFTFFVHKLLVSR